MMLTINITFYKNEYVKTHMFNKQGDKIYENQIWTLCYTFDGFYL